MTDKPEDDVWIEAPLSSAGIDPIFYGMATVSYPFGINGPAIAAVKLNLTAYIKHMIEKQANE